MTYSIILVALRTEAAHRVGANRVARKVGMGGCERVVERLRKGVAGQAAESGDFT